MKKPGDVDVLPSSSEASVEQAVRALQLDKVYAAYPELCAAALETAAALTRDIGSDEDHTAPDAGWSLRGRR